MVSTPRQRYWSGKKKRWLQAHFSRYLERWNTLVKEITGRTLPLFNEQEVADVLTQLKQYSDAWNTMQDPRCERNRREQWRFPKRKHFPNFNFAMCEVLKRLQKTLKWNPNTDAWEPVVRPGFQRGFPLPTTPSSLKRLREYWNALEQHLGYIPRERKLRQITLTGEDAVETEQRPTKRQKNQ